MAYAMTIFGCLTQKLELVNIKKLCKTSALLIIAISQRFFIFANCANLNSVAERFVRTVKEECLNHLILSSEEQLGYVLSKFLDYYHTGRIHQGLGRIIDPIYGNNIGDIFCIERLGGLLKSYHRKSA